MALGCYSYLANATGTLDHIACSGIHYKQVLKGPVGILVDQFFNATGEDRCLYEKSSLMYATGLVRCNPSRACFGAHPVSCNCFLTHSDAANYVLANRPKRHSINTPSARLIFCSRFHST